MSNLLLRKLFTHYSKSIFEKVNLNKSISSSLSIKQPTFATLIKKNSFPIGFWNYSQVRYLNLHKINQPSPETCKKNLRFKVHYPKDGKYTITHLPMTKLGGRDPVTGRIIFGCIGGGHKRKYRWIQRHRVPLDHDSHTIIEKVVSLQYDPNRSAHIALVGQADKVRFIIATSTMKKGDLILSTKELPKMTIRPKEGNAHPVGALPMGTKICCIERYPKGGSILMTAAGCSATVLRKVKNKIYVKLDTHREICLDVHCMAVVGSVSNEENARKPIGSAWRLRWLGRRPRSGLWQRKTGRQGYKKKKMKTIIPRRKKKRHPVIYLTAHGEGPLTPVIPSTLRVS